MSLAKWEQALAHMEDELDVHEAQVRTGQTTLVPAWQPPDDLGELPPQLAERVMNLVRRIGLLSTFVQFQLVAAEYEHIAAVKQAVKIPVIGIGAGSDTDGQVLVMHDVLGLSLTGRSPKFVRNFMEGQTSVQAAFAAYVRAVKDSSFPAEEHGFSA